MTRFPKKREILQRANETSTTRAIIHGLPSITPTESELKETGEYDEARVELMRSPETSIMLEQRRYLDEMAAEMRLKIVSAKDFQKYEKGVVDEWRFMQKVKKAEFEREKTRRFYLESLKREKQLKKKYAKQLPKAQAFDIFRKTHPKKVVKTNGYKIVLPAIPQPTVPQIKQAKHKPKKPKRPSPIIPKVKLPSVPTLPRMDVKPKRKRKRNHTQRSGKTMRKLRKVKGVKVFSFPDHVWKVRK